MPTTPSIHPPPTPQTQPQPPFLRIGTPNSLRKTLLSQTAENLKTPTGAGILPTHASPGCNGMQKMGLRLKVTRVEKDSSTGGVGASVIGHWRRGKESLS